MAHKMNGPKRYGDRTAREMNKDIRKERKILKEEGATRAEVKEYNKYQRRRKKQIRTDIKGKR